LELSFLDLLLGTEEVFEMKERIYPRLRSIGLF
jgi:hypothetical protein